MKKVIKLEGIPLTEGHSGLYLEIENGIIERGVYFALIPVRGFETLLLGKDSRIAPTITTRICGLCQVTHAIASARAVESASAIEVPPEAEKLREVLGLAVRVYNNLLHQIVISEDLFPDRGEQLDFIRKIQEVRKFAGVVLETIGGEIIHSPNVRVGGISEPLEEFVKEKLLLELEPALEKLKDSFSAFKEGLDELWKREGLPEDFGRHDLGYFATDVYYGKPVDFSRFSFIYPQQLLDGEVRRRVSNLFPLVDGRPVETGPRARAVLFKGYKPRGGAKEIHVLRGEESIEALLKIQEILEKNRFDVELWNRTNPSSDGETLGVGVHEAPRGSNFHFVKLDKSGRIVYYKIVVPTELNFFAVGEALKGTPVERAELVVRAYDPCIVCAAH